MKTYNDNYTIGYAAFKRGDYRDAVTALETATREEPGNYSAFVFLAAAYSELERYNAAIGALKKAEELKPNVASIHYNLGQAYEAAGLPRQACREYRVALRINTRYGLARGALGALMARMADARMRRADAAA